MPRLFWQVFQAVSASFFSLQQPFKPSLHKLINSFHSTHQLTRLQVASACSLNSPSFLRLEQFASFSNSQPRSWSAGASLILPPLCCSVGSSLPTGWPLLSGRKLPTRRGPPIGGPLLLPSLYSDQQADCGGPRSPGPPLGLRPGLGLARSQAPLPPAQALSESRWSLRSACLLLRVVATLLPCFHRASYHPSGLVPRHLRVLFGTIPARSERSDHADKSGGQAASP